MKRACFQWNRLLSYWVEQITTGNGYYQRIQNSNLLKMGLLLNEAKEVIKNPRNQKWIEKAVHYEQRLRLHTENVLTKDDVSPAYDQFTNWVKSILPNDKYLEFTNLVRFPVPTVEFTEGIFSELHKLFQAQDSFREDIFTSSEIQEDAAEFYNARYGDFFETVAFQKMKNRINSVLVIDAPSEQVTENPDPRCFFVNIEDVIDIDTIDNGDCRYFVFRVNAFNDQNEPIELNVQMDDEFIRVFIIKDGGSTLITEVIHGLGECPARQFWTTNLQGDNNILKMSPIAGSISKLDSLLFKDVSKDYANLYSQYPILAIIEEKCSYVDKANNACNEGYVNSQVLDPASGKDGTEQTYFKFQNACPSCAVRKTKGAGSIITVPAPEENEPEIKVPAQFITVEVDSLKNIAEDVEATKRDIFGNSVGRGSDVMNKQALNQDQTNLSFESKQAVLMRIKKNFEIIEGWKRRLLFKWRHGKDYLSSTVNYGRNFFLRTVQDLENEKKIAIENGVSESELIEIQKNIIQTKYRDNPNTMKTLQIKLNLEPFPLMSKDKVIEIKDSIDRKDFIKKLYFDEFIRRFEREQLPIIKFGELLGFDVKIKIINQILDSYVTEKQTEGKIEGQGQLGTDD